MTTKKTTPPATTTLPFDRFWVWLQAHPNCILRAGTPDAVIFDDDDFHWHFAAEGDGLLLVQVIRGKQLVGELLIQPAEIAYVQVEAQTTDEFVFELITESAKDRITAVHFVLSHSFDEEEQVTPGRWTH